MHDIRFIRDAPDHFDQSIARRGYPPAAADIIALDTRLRALVTRKQQSERTRKALARQSGQARADGDTATFDTLRAEAAQERQTIENAEKEEVSLRQQRDDMLAGLPNCPHPNAPAGADETANVEIRRSGTPHTRAFAVRDHVELGTALTTSMGVAMMDFTATARISGARFVTLSGPLARLERALVTFMLDMHVAQHGYTEVSPPFLVRPEAVYGTGQLPKFAEDLFRLQNGHYAIPTAEVPLTNLARERLFSPSDLPLRMTAATPCFRAEAGSAGKDTRGLIRLHQFPKVELVSICAPDEAGDELERMTSCAEAVLTSLDLPYRVVDLCTGDMGFAARRTYDLEVWMPSQNTYREISSCSDCADFQARRINARVRAVAADEKKIAHVHSFNGSALAVGRTLAALIENFQNEDGSITLPDAIRPLMNGLDRIA